jgi:hypothetical protein
MQHGIYQVTDETGSVVYIGSTSYYDLVKLESNHRYARSKGYTMTNFRIELESNPQWKFSWAQPPRNISRQQIEIEEGALIRYLEPKYNFSIHLIIKEGIMANHVYTYLKFDNLSPPGTKALQDLYEQWTPLKSSWDREVSVSDIMFGPESEDATYENMCEVVGAKWAYVTDYDCEGITMYSAWSVPEGFIRQIVETVGNHDPDVIALAFYEDEYHNFVGVDLYTKDGMEDGSSMDGDELFGHMMETYPFLAEEWDEEEQIWKDEGEQWNELICECVDEFQRREAASMVQGFLNEPV